MVAQTLAVCVAAGLATWYLNHYLKRGPVLASAIVTLTAGLILPVLFADAAALVAVAACASYVGMSATIRLRNSLETILALGLAALIFLVSADIFVGVGGKLGTIAAVSVMAVWGCRQSLQALPWKKLAQVRLQFRIF